MKKIKYLSVFLILAMAFTMPVLAHNVTLDSNNIITIPDDPNIISSAKITVSESYGEYNLSYQYVEIDKETYDAYNTILQEKEDYQAKDFPSNNDDAEAKRQYEAEIAQYEKSMQELLPSYQNSNWKNSTDNTVPLDVTGIDTEKNYVLWVKVNKKQGDGDAVYQNAVVNFKPSNDNVTSPSTGDNTLWLALGALAVGALVIVSYKKIHA